MNVNHQASLKPYYLRFLGTYVLLYFVLFLIVFLFKIEKISAANVIVTIATGLTVVGSFLKHEKRPPSDFEKNRLVWGSLIIVIAVELLLGLLTVFGGGTEGYNGIKDSGHMNLIVGILVVVVILFLLVDYFMLRWIYGKQAAKMFERM